MSLKLNELTKHAIFPASSIMDKQREIIKWSPALNDILGGGLSTGSFVILTGNYKVGKTAAALHFGGKAQALGYKVYYINVEHRLSRRDLESSIIDQDEEKLQIIQSSEDSILTAEDFIATVENKIRNEQSRIFIFDSLSQLCAEDLMTADIRDRYRDSTPLLLSRFVKRIAAPIDINNHIFIGIVHEIANQGPGMATKIEASGRKIQYAANFKVKACYSSKWEEGDQRVGQVIHWQCIYSAIGPPDRKAEGSLRYGYGLDEEKELVDFACSTGVINSRMSLKIENDSYRGKNAMAEGLRKYPEERERIRQELVLRLGHEI